MPTVDNQPVRNYREELVSRARTRFPDRNFGDPNDPNGPNDLARSAVEMLDEYDSKQKDYDTNNQRLVGLFKSDPRSAEFLTRWVSDGDPLAAMIETFGDEFQEAMASPEARERYVEAHNKWLERKAEDDRAAAQREENWNKSLETLQEFGDEMGLSDDEKVKTILRLHQVGVNAIDGIYTKDDFKMAYDASNYDNAVRDARHEGEIAGRNARINERMRERRQPETMPPALAGQGAPVSEPRPRKRTEADKVREMFGLGK